MLNIISRLSKREKIIFSTAILFVCFALLDRLVINPIVNKMKLYSEDIKKTEFEVIKNTKIIAQKSRIEAEEKKYAIYASKAKSDEEETAALLREIESLASRSSVYLVDLKPAGINKEALIKKFLVNVSCEGEMERLVAFMHLIESSHVIMQIAAFDIGPKSTKSKINRCELLINKIAIP